MPTSSACNHNDDPILANRQAIFDTLSQLVDPLSRTMPQSEIVVHDLDKLPDSIIAIGGDVTHRKIGDPATDTLLAEAAKGQVRTKLNYHTTLPDGRELRSTTIAIHDSDGNVFATLCINSEISLWKQLADVAGTMTGGIQPTHSKENFVQNVDQLAKLVLDQAIEEQNIPVELMKKEHKLRALQKARDNGIFLLRDAADTVADRLHVSRFTIYNYLKELDEGAEDNQPSLSPKYT